jgi:hypothetical protein
MRRAGGRILDCDTVLGRGTLGGPVVFERDKTMRTRTRHIYGRLTMTLGGQVVRVEMRRDGIWFREKHSRKPTRLTFHDAHAASLGQQLLPLIP